jgi:hypothetical protein
MYFVTTKREGYILFCTTPSERAALGLTEQQIVHLLVRTAIDQSWRVIREWNASQYSHTDFLTALHHIQEPADPHELARFLPAELQ